MSSTTTNLAPHFMIFHFIFAYVAISTRGVKNYFKIDHNSSPRGDTAKYGEQMVKDGKMKRSTLDMIVRWEGAHANSVEHFPMFATSVLIALQSHTPTAHLNYLMTLYTLSRLGFTTAYILITSESLSWLRTLCWWSGNIACLRMLWGAIGKIDSFA